MGCRAQQSADFVNLLPDAAFKLAPVLEGNPGIAIPHVWVTKKPAETGLESDEPHH